MIVQPTKKGAAHSLESASELSTAIMPGEQYMGASDSIKICRMRQRQHNILANSTAFVGSEIDDSLAIIEEWPKLA